MERSLAPEHKDGCAVVVFFSLAGTKDLVWCKVWDETDGKLAPNETAHGNKAEWEQQWSKDLFFFVHSTKKALWIQKNNLEAVWFSQRRVFLQTPTAGCCFLTDFRLDIWWHFLYVATNDWVTAHLSLMCCRARRSQIFMKIVDEFSFWNWIVIRRPKIVVDDRRWWWSLFLTDVLHE